MKLQTQDRPRLWVFSTQVRGERLLGERLQCVSAIPSCVLRPDLVRGMRSFDVGVSDFDPGDLDLRSGVLYPVKEGES